MPQKILIVDDERRICEILEFNLLNEGFETAIAYSAEEALELLPSGFSLIILDVMMSGMSGYKLAEQLRSMNNHTPIIFLSAMDAENDILTGFSVGGDDYIPKPFSVMEVIARVKAVLKRLHADTDSAYTGKLQIEDMTFDFDTKEFAIGSDMLSLTKTEFEILSLLATNPSKIFHRNEIIEKLWKDTPYITERTVDVHITRLRKKMGDKASLISNRPGYGYRFMIPTK